MRVVSNYLLNLQGWHTNRKILVIESDDWGSIRMPSKEIYDSCLRAGYPVDKIAYEKYDSLLSKEDLELLFDLLQSFKNYKGEHPVITANCVVANPNFIKIKDGGFTNYHYELITDTFKRYPNHSTNFALWLEAIGSRVLFPQYHAREHLNVSSFMNALKNRDPHVIFGFNNMMPGCIPMGPEPKGNSYVEALNYCDEKDKEEKLKIYLEGLDLFYNLFGFKSVSIIPPNYIWSKDFDEPAKSKGVNVFQGIRWFMEPIPSENRRSYHRIFTGKRNMLGQVYLRRNAFFEPSLFRFGIKDPVGECLAAISAAFRMNRPSIICSHRINFAGFIDVTNRDRTLQLFRQLLFTVLKRWPDIEFMTSPQLGELILSQ